MAAALAVLVSAGIAAAGPYTEVASAFDEGDRFDLHVTLDYGFELNRATIRREASGVPGTDPDDPIPFEDEFNLVGSRHVLVPRLELGAFTDLSLSMAMPIVVSDSRTLKLAGDRAASSTINDGILPMNGFDANDPGGPGFTDGDTIFRSPTRAGVDQIHFGLTWAPMNQVRDDTKPTWKIGGELRLAIGAPMALNRADPGSETGVGRGVTEVRLWTSMAKRVGWAEPYVDLWWQAPLSLSSDSPFNDLGFGQVRGEPQQRAGTRFGFEAITWKNEADTQRISLDFTATFEAMFEGRAYSPMWEVFQFAGTAGSGGPLVLDSDPTVDGVQELTHPGVSNLENYLRFGGRLGLRAVLGDKVRFGAGFELIRSQAHVITFADAGRDLPTCQDGNTIDCEVNANDVVDPGTEEVNPSHVPLIDLVGSRYAVTGVSDFVFSVDARVLF